MGLWEGQEWPFCHQSLSFSDIAAEMWVGSEAPEPRVQVKVWAVVIKEATLENRWAVQRPGLHPQQETPGLEQIWNCCCASHTCYWPCPTCRPVTAVSEGCQMTCWSHLP